MTAERAKRFERLTQAGLKAIIHYDAETGVFTNLTNRGKSKAGTVAGGLDGMGYWQISIRDRPYRGHRLAWLYVHGEWPKQLIDHINCDRGDNRLINLRAACHAENCRNSLGRGSSCGVKGVTHVRKTGKYIAQIKHDGVHHYLGCFDLLGDAEKAYEAGALRLHGEFARTA